MSAHAQFSLPPQPADRWLAVLRIVVGLWFLKSVATKLEIFLAFGVLPLPRASARWVSFMPRRLLEYAETVRIEAYQDFLVNTVVPASHVFAHLTAFGEAAVGIGLAFGLLTRPASAIGFVMMINYLLATLWVGFCQQGFHTLLVVGMVAFFAASAGRTWGVDGWIARRFPGSPLRRYGVI